MPRLLVDRTVIRGAGYFGFVELPAAANVQVDMLDVAGRRVRAIWQGILPSGKSALSWDLRGDSGDPVRAGVMFVRLQAMGHAVVKRVVLLR